MQCIKMSQVSRLRTLCCFKMEKTTKTTVTEVTVCTATNVLDAQSLLGVKAR